MAVARKHAAAREAARARSTRAVDGIQKPIVDAHAAVKPHRMIDARDHELGRNHGNAMGLESRIEQVKIGYVGEQAAMQGLLVRQLVDRAEPDVLDAGRLLAPQVIGTLHRAKFEGALLLENPPRRLGQLVAQFAIVGFHVRQSLGLRHVRDGDLVIEARFRHLK